MHVKDFFCEFVLVSLGDFLSCPQFYSFVMGDVECLADVVEQIIGNAGFHLLTSSSDKRPSLTVRQKEQVKEGGNRTTPLVVGGELRPRLYHLPVRLVAGMNMGSIKQGVERALGEILHVHLGRPLWVLIVNRDLERKLGVIPLFVR
ncbi:MAG: hypothetical protein EOP06_15200 [Proteobacteria bacterium]|nr:MAG: hypothetical protein EOP06_15200 [Pseudomonadota bacterium]